MTDQRQHRRTPMSAPVKLTVGDSGSLDVTLRDLSEGGVFLKIGDAPPPPLGSLVTVQVQGLPDAPLVQARVVRVEDEGIGLMFL